MPKLKQLFDKRKATHRRYIRTGRADLLDEFLRLSNEVDERVSRECNSLIHNHLADALDENKNIWKEMRNLDLLPQRKEDNLHGFTPGELNTHFSGISVSPLENIDEAMKIIRSASKEGFVFKQISLTDIVLAISHFSSQARGTDGIPQKIIVRALPAIGDYLVQIFNSSFA